MKKLLQILYTIFVFLAASAFSVFMWFNITERIFYIDIPFVDTVVKTALPSNLVQANIVSETDKYGFFGKPATLRIPSLNYALPLAEGIKQKDQWLINKSSASFSVLEKSNSGYMGDLLVFSQGEMLSFVKYLDEGERFMIDTSQGYRYHLKINKIQKHIDNANLLISHDDSLQVVILYRENEKVSYILEAYYMNLEEL